MGFASHLGAWRLGTVKDTTGTTASTTSNMGCTAVAQSNTVEKDDTTATNMFAIPAGAQILDIYLDVTEAFNAGTNNTITIKVGSTTIASVVATGANIAVGRQTLTLAATASWVNTAADSFITATFTGTGTAATTGIGYVTALYVVRAPDGAQAPTATQN